MVKAILLTMIFVKFNDVTEEYETVLERPFLLNVRLFDTATIEMYYTVVEYDGNKSINVLETPAQILELINN